MMGTKEDHDLLIRIDERLVDIQRDYATKSDITSAINCHKIADHSRKSLPPASGGGSVVTKERVIWTIVSAIAAALAGGQAFL
jgi:hypothetical protein